MASSTEMEVVAASQARILVCDDAPSMRAMMAAVLGRSYNLALTASAEEALQKAPAFAPDLVITDHILPGITGRALVAHLRAIPAFEDVPIILLTAVSDADARAEGIEAGADEYLVKPIRERELRARVASLLKLRSTLLALSRRSRELEDANAALRETQGRLVRTERLAALGSLAASLAHDINNPLAVIASGAAVLRDLSAHAERAGEPADTARFARIVQELKVVSSEILQASRRMQALGRDLRLFGSGDPATADRIFAEEVVRTAATLACARSSQPPTIDVRVDGAPELEAPAHLVTLALLAVIDRAVCAAGPTGRIGIEVCRVFDDVEIAVRDDGRPIPVELLPRVFEPFVRLCPEHTSSGLGLSVAAGIVQGLGGHIDVDGRATVGARFVVRLPSARRSTEA